MCTKVFKCADKKEILCDRLTQSSIDLWSGINVSSTNFTQNSRKSVTCIWYLHTQFKRTCCFQKSNTDPEHITLMEAWWRQHHTMGMQLEFIGGLLGGAKCRTILKASLLKKLETGPDFHLPAGQHQQHQVLKWPGQIPKISKRKQILGQISLSREYLFRMWFWTVLTPAAWIQVHATLFRFLCKKPQFQTTLSDFF